MKTRTFSAIALLSVFVFSIFAGNALDVGKEQAGSPRVAGLDPPKQIHLTWQRDPSRSVTVTWKTTFDTGTHRVRYGFEPGSYIYEATGSSHESPNQLVGRIHDVEIRDLLPGTTYYYKCGDAWGGWSDEHHFMTLPDGASHLMFTVGGDDGTTSNAVAVVEQVAEAGGAFHVHTGDLACADGAQPLWDTWFSNSEILYTRSPVLPCIGNHEDEDELGFGFDSYLGRFALANNERWYSLDCGNVHVVSIDYESDYHPGSIQYDWLEADLAAASTDPGIDWIITFDHKPPYSSSDHGSSEGFRNAVCPLLDRYGVDLHFSGHDHNYERSYPLKDEQVTSYATDYYENPDGTIYVVSGGGGRWLYTNGESYWTAYSESCHHYCQIDVYPEGTLEFRMQRVNDCPILFLYGGSTDDRQLRDEFVIYKTGPYQFRRENGRKEDNESDRFVRAAYMLRDMYLHDGPVGREFARIYSEWGVEALRSLRRDPVLALEAANLLSTFLKELEGYDGGDSSARRTFDGSYVKRLGHLWESLHEDATPGFRRELEFLQPYISRMEGKNIEEILNNLSSRRRE